MSQTSLSTGCLLEYFQGGPTIQKPIVQIVDLKIITPEKALMAVADGKYVTQALLNGPALELANEKQVSINCIVRLEAFVPAPARAKLPPGVLIVQNMVVLQHNASALDQIVSVASALANAGANAGEGPEATNTPASSNMSSTGGAQGQAVGKNPYGAPAARQSPSTYMANGVALTRIRAISPYQRSWTIKARVTNKSDIRTWSNAKGEGKLFSIELLDQFGGQIRATMYNAACEKWFPVLQENQVYLVSRCTVRPARRGFNRVINDYELTIEESSEVTHVPDDQSIGVVGLTARKTIGQISEMKISSTNESNSASAGAGGEEPLVDIVGIVVEAKPIAKLLSKKTSRELCKRDVSIVDRSLLRIDLTLWGEQAERFTEEILSGAPCIVATACRVSDFNGRSLSTSFTSQVYLNPEMTEVAELRKWYDTEGHNCPFTLLSSTGGGGSGVRSKERKSFLDINDHEIRLSNQAEWITVRATITSFRNEREAGKTLWYEGCPSCNRKVHSVGDGWSCDSCSKSFPVPSYVYNFSFQAADSFSSRWISVFGAKGDTLMGVPAATMADYLGSNQTQEYDERINAVRYKTFEMRIQARMTTSREGEPTVRCSLWQATPLNYLEEARRMLNELNI